MVSNDIEEIRENAFVEDFINDWPSGVHGISVPGLRLFGVNENKELFWDGKQVEVRKTLSLSLFQKVGAFVTVMSAAIAAVATAYSTYLEAIKSTVCP